MLLKSEIEDREVLQVDPVGPVGSDDVELALRGRELTSSGCRPCPRSGCCTWRRRSGRRPCRPGSRSGSARSGTGGAGRSSVRPCSGTGPRIRAEGSVPILEVLARHHEDPMAVRCAVDGGLDAAEGTAAQQLLVLAPLVALSPSPGSAPGFGLQTTVWPVGPVLGESAKLGRGRTSRARHALPHLPASRAQSGPSNRQPGCPPPTQS